MKKFNRTVELMWFSFRDIMIEPFRVLELFKKPRTWTFVLYGVLFYSMYLHRPILNTIIIFGIILILHLIRQNKEPDFNRYVKEKAFKDDNKELLDKYYAKYEERCFYTRNVPLSFDEWKEKEKARLLEKTRTAQEQDDTE